MERLGESLGNAIDAKLKGPAITIAISAGILFIIMLMIIIFIILIYNSLKSLGNTVTAIYNKILTLTPSSPSS